MDARDYKDAYQRDDKPREVKSNRAWRLECESLRQQLAECERERDEWKTGAIKRDNARHDAIEQLSACQKERDALSGGYDEVRDELAEAEHILVDMRKRLATVTAERDELVAVLTECRSSVKFDLLHYEKMSRAYGNLGSEGREKHEMAEVEANRLNKLIDTIDALAKVDADKTGDGS